MEKCSGEGLLREIPHGLIDGEGQIRVTTDCETDEMTVKWSDSAVAHRSPRGAAHAYRNRGTDVVQR